MNTGFSLSEVLVSLAIVSLIALITLSGLTTSLDFNKRTLDRSDFVNSLVILDNYMKKDFQQTINRLSRDARGSYLNHSFFGLNPRQEGVFLAFTINSGDISPNFPKGGLRFIEYIIEEGTLKRVEYSYADRTFGTPYTSQSLLKNVEEVKLNFIKENSTLEEWPAMDWMENNGLPNIVEISLNINNFGLINRRYLLTGEAI